MLKWLLGALFVLGFLVPDDADAWLGPKPKPGVTRPVILVGNNWDGTTDIVDARTFKRLDRINVVPDLPERMGEIVASPDRLGFFLLIRQEIGEGHDQFNDDVFSSNDGSTIYVSRPSLADVVAIDLATKKIKWRAPVDGYRSDHMAISKDGKRLLVSASTANVVHQLDTATGKRTGMFESGDSPHENNFSADGTKIFHASIGRVYAPTDQPAVDGPSKGGQFFQIVDAKTLKILKRIDMGEKLDEAGYPNMSAAVRPMALSPDEHFLYFQVSFFHGFVEYDLVKDKVTRVAKLPIKDPSMPREQYLLDSAHHGLAMDPTGHKLCVAGTMSDYGAIVHREDFSYKIVDDKIHKPYWSTNSGDGRYCYISASGDDQVVVVDYATEKVLTRFDVGDHPQRVRNGVVRVSQYPEPPAQAMRLRVRGGMRRVTCVAPGTQLLRCRVSLRARGRVIGHGERLHRGASRLAVPVRLTPSGRRMVRHGLRRASVIAVATDAAGRTARGRFSVSRRRG
jgi:YVTN family beta-propeller protein